jgi:hypothetical protein
MLDDPFVKEGGGNTNAPIVLLVKKIKEMGHRASTIDTGNLYAYDKVIFFEFPEFRRTGLPDKYLRGLIKYGLREMYLVCMEPPAIKPNNWNMDNHRYFKKIFTWNDGYIDNKKYFRIHSTSHGVNDTCVFSLKDKTKLCVLIARNKFSDHPAEIYSQRVRAIRWFENFYPEDFDLYGEGWDEFIFKGRLSFLNLIDYYFKRIGAIFSEGGFLQKFFCKLAKFNRFFYIILYQNHPAYPSYKGRVLSVRETLKKYKFCICFENSVFPGWVTERIFDCFLAGCIPVYLGDPNITDKIPDNAFIDMRMFENYEKLYDYLKKMTENEYLSYIEAIKSFRESSQNYTFTIEYFAETLLRELNIN